MHTYTLLLVLDIPLGSPTCLKPDEFMEKLPIVYNCSVYTDPVGVVLCVCNLAYNTLWNLAYSCVCLWPALHG